LQGEVVEDVLGTSNFLRGVRLSSSLFVKSHEDRFHVAKLSCMRAAFRAEEEVLAGARTKRPS
jgi:hypothetical protein